MKYSVFWKPAAENQLASLWVAAPDRDIVAAAADHIDVWLRTNPETRGESREGNERILLHFPLAVLFRVFAEDLKVEVGAVWRWGRIKS